MERTLPQHPSAETSGGHPKQDAYVGTVMDGRYLVEKILGEGGMGVVYLGRHKSLDKRVAIKVLKRELAEDRDMLERFFNEARAASSIGSQHIVDISDFGMLPDGSAYFVMELLDGRSLGEMMDVLKIVPTPRLVKVARQIGQALSAAHAAGIVHRDLKPDNIMLIQRGNEPDFVKILDFGIAKVTNAATRLTRTGSVFGTPHYMSPEQAAGLSVDSRGDIYALGIILYEMACGKVPFDSDNYMGILTQHMYKAPPPPRTLVVPPNAVSPGLEAIIMKCLTKKPEGRYQTMDALVADLDTLSGGMTPLAVGELMARSGNYNVPADYFHDRPPAHGNGQTLPPSSGVGASNRRVGVMLGVSAGLAIGAVLVMVYAFREPSSKGATISSATAPVLSVLAPLPTAPIATTATSGTKKRFVAVLVTPNDAHVTLASGAPVLVERGIARIELAPNEPTTISVSHSGFTPAQLTLGDTSSELERVDLVGAGKPGTKPASTPEKPPTPVTPQVPATVTVPPVPVPPHTAPKKPDRPAHCASIPRDDESLKAYPECR